MKRKIGYILSDFLQNKEAKSSVLLVEGARQVGKTYLVEDALKSLDQSRVVSINLEKEKDLKLEIDGIKDFKDFTKWLGFKKGFKDDSNYIVFIDEAQESKTIGNFVLSMKEEWKKSKIILTGSSMNKLFDGTVRVPVGRIEYLTVWPFSFFEFLKFGDLDRQAEFIANFDVGSEVLDPIHIDLLKRYDEYLSIGGMPGAVDAYYAGKDPVQVLRFIIASQQDDFQRKEAQLKENLFLDGIKAVSNSIGYPFKKTHISRSDYDSSAVLALLKQWFIVLEVMQRGSSPSRDNFYPKEYLYDLGVLRIIRETVIPNISAFNTLNEKLRAPLGGLIENAVLLNMLEGRGGFYEIGGWKSSAGKEVDFIYKEKDNCLPIEVKASLNISNRHAKNLVHYLVEHKLKTGLIISLDKPKKFKIAGMDVINMPAYLFSQELIRQICAA